MSFTLNADVEEALRQLELADGENQSQKQKQHPLRERFSGASFSVIDTLNELLPSASALHSLDAIAADLAQQHNAVDADVRESVQRAACERHRARLALNDARDAVHELFAKGESIKSKAAASQKLVNDMSADIRVLDTAKTNLTRTITALKRLHMIGNAVDQLRSSVERREFVRAANMVEAFEVLDADFKELHNVPALQLVRKKTSDCRDRLRSAVFEAFDAAHATGADDDEVDMLSEACAVAQVLGPDCRSELVEAVVRRLLEPYRVVFTPSDGGGGDGGSVETDDATLDHVERRYSWLRKLLKAFATKFGRVFPPHWNAAGILCAEFCTLTQRHLSTLLQREQRNATLDVAVFVRVLTQTISFEDELDRLYARPSESGLQRFYDGDPDKFEEAVEPGSAEAIRRKHKAKQNDAEWQQREQEALASMPSSRPEAAAPVELQLKGAISHCFEPFMDCYMRLERNNINELIDEVERSEDWSCASLTSSTTSTNRFQGSDELFLYIKRSMQRFNKLNLPSIAFELQKEYVRGLIKLAELLGKQIPGKLASGLLPELSVQQIHALGVLTNTAEYCSEVLPQLRESIQKMVDEQQRDDVDLEQVQDSFDALVNGALEMVSACIMQRIEKVLESMARLSLSSMEAVGDSSPYVPEIRAILERDVSALSSVVSVDYYDYFCSKLVQQFMPTFLRSISSCRRIGELGAQQLLLDAEALKTVLLSLPSLGGGDAEPQVEQRKKRSASSYAQMVVKQIAKAEAILKCISHPPDSLAETFAALVPGGNASDLIKIMELKGCKKNEQQSVVSAYNAASPPERQQAPLLKESLDSSATVKKFFLFG